MGWMYEYLGEQLVDEICEWLGRNGGVPPCFNDVELDPKTYTRLYAGSDRPETGHFEGYAFIGEDKRRFAIVYTVRRRMPSDGFDYGLYEHEYECRLIRCDRVIDGEQAVGDIDNVGLARLLAVLKHGPWPEVDELVDSLLSKIEQIQKDYELLADVLRKFKETKCS